MMNNLQFLILEDRVTDYELAIRELRKRGLEFAARRVDNEPDFRRQIEGFRPDVILADQSLPGYSGMSALAVARQECPAVPFIFLSGTLGEEQAVECLKLGATDYVLKQRLERLVPAVKRALREAEDRRARLQVEAEFRAMFEVASIGMGQADPRTGQLLRVNQKMCAITGYSAAELLGMRVSELTHPDDRQQDWEKFERVVRGEVSDYRLEKRYLRKDGSVAWVNVNMTVIRDAVGQPTRTMATIEDITERKRTEESHARLATAVEQAAETIVITDTQGAILYANPAFEKTSGYTRAEVIGQNPRLLKSGKHAAEFYRQIWTVLTRGEVWSGRFINQKKDG
ncbi:MAG: PAS domain S-box protein, partial [Verrucomicrobiota bacterium]